MRKYILVAATLSSLVLELSAQGPSPRSTQPPLKMQRSLSESMSGLTRERALAGQIYYADSEKALAGATVRLITPDWKTVLKEVKTDEEGRFSLTSEQSADVHEYHLSVSAEGMGTQALRVELSNDRGLLQIFLQKH